MSKNDVILVGVKRFVSKAGKEYAVLQTTAPFNLREQIAGSVGCKVEETFVPETLLNKVDSLKINAPIKFDYEVVGRNAYIVDFSQDK